MSESPGADPPASPPPMPPPRTAAPSSSSNKNKEIGGPIRTSGGSFLSELRPLNIPDRFSLPFHRLRFLAPTVEAVFPYVQPDLCVLRRPRPIPTPRRTSHRRRCPTAPLHRRHRPPRSPRPRHRSHRPQPLNQSVTWQAATTIDSTGHRSVLLNARFRRFGVGAEYDLYAPHYDQGDMLLLVGTRVGLHHGAPGDSPDHPLPYLDRLLAEAGAFLFPEGASNRSHELTDEERKARHAQLSRQNNPKAGGQRRNRGKRTPAASVA